MRSDYSEKITTRDLLIVLFLMISVLSVYWKTYENDFIITFDDNHYVFVNNYVKNGISLESIRWAFHFSQKGDRYYWHPLTWISHMIDCQIFGLKAGMHHLSNVAYHLINTVLIFFIFRLMTGAVWRSALISILFALHPVNVESVAWIAERKNLLSTTFWMLTILSYIYYTRMPRLSRYIPVLILFSLGLLAKPMLVTLPFVLLLLDYWPLRRLDTLISLEANINKEKERGTFSDSLKDSGAYKVFIEKIPLIIISLILVYLSSMSLKNIGNDISTDLVPMALRVQNAIVSYISYFLKMIWPVGLAVYHPFPDAVGVWNISLSMLILVLVSVISIYYSKKLPYLFVGWFWFLGTLLPAIGFIQGGLWPAYAERWAYIPYIGLFLIISWGGNEILLRFHRNKALKAVTLAVILVALLFLGSLTFKQIRYWENDLTLFAHAVEVNPDNAVAHNNLGLTYAHNGLHEKAIYHYQEALRVRPYLADSYYNMGLAYYEVGKVNDAILCFNKAIEIKPQFEKPHYSLSEIYFKNSDISRAIYQLNEILKISPDNLAAHNKLGIILAQTNKTEEAMNHFNKILKIDPKFQNLHNNIGNIYLLKNDNENAEKEFKIEIQLYPIKSEAYINLGIAYMNMGKDAESANCYKKAMELDPSSEKARAGLRNALDKRKNIDINRNKTYDTTMMEVQKAIDKDPSNANLHYELAKLYSGKGDDEKAIHEYQLAIAIEPNFVQANNKIAIIYSEKKDYKRSLRYLKKVIEAKPEDPEGYYNIACICSLQNDVDQSFIWLKTAVDKGFNNWDLVQNDKDLENLRKSSLYKDILKLKH